jgi:hypothetical protein
MTKPAVFFLTCALFALSTVTADAGHHPRHHSPAGPKDTQDPKFNPLEFPLCFVWDPVTQRDVWICGRYAY